MIYLFIILSISNFNLYLYNLSPSKLHRLYNKLGENMMKNEELEKTIDILQLQIKEQEVLLKTKDDIILKQSKLASLGEIINNISHQWKQPLMEISALNMNLEAKIMLEQTISNDSVLETMNKSNEILKFMSNTIDDFRNFFSTNKETKTYLISEILSNVTTIINHSLSSNNIKLNIIIKHNFKITCIKNELIQALINIISNSKDAIMENTNQTNGTINIILYKKNNHNILKICDNGDGIKAKNIDDIFNPFVTINKKNGTGVGLFMSKLIIEDHMPYKLLAHNIKNGACFKIIF